jgi:hypothetical protein
MAGDTKGLKEPIAQIVERQQQLARLKKGR